MSHTPLVAITDDDPITRASVGRASALEASLLDHLAAHADTRIMTMGHNLGFAFGTVTLLVRNLAWATAPDAAETIDAIGRARDNGALLAEGAVARLRAIDAEQDARRLVDTQELLKITREALRQQSLVQRQIHAEIDSVFEAIRDEFEQRFPQLGLTAEQEDQLDDILVCHRSRGLAVLARGRLAEEGLRCVVERLEHSSPGPI